MYIRILAVLADLQIHFSTIFFQPRELLVLRCPSGRHLHRLHRRVGARSSPGASEGAAAAGSDRRRSAATGVLDTWCRERGEREVVPWEVMGKSCESDLESHRKWLYQAAWRLEDVGDYHSGVESTCGLSTELLRRAPPLSTDTPGTNAVSYTPRNLVITGNPGAGKTTYGHLLARLFHSHGLLPMETFLKITGSSDLQRPRTLLRRGGSPE